MTRIGDYEIEAELGEGGMAKVYRAKHAFLETVHALKVLDPSYRVQPEARKRFLDEAKIQAKHLDHDNIVKVTNIVATADHAALVMELVDGPSLESMLGELKSRPDEITRIMIGVLDAVGHAHAAGIIHRDLKPANVLLAREDGVLVPKVTDFGIAKVTDASKGGVKKSTHAAARMGTLSYMSPEQIRRAKDVTARSDIFSLGVMLYEMATGELAFPGDSEYDVMENIVNGRYTPPRQRHPQIDAVHAQVIEKAMATDPAQRYASCAEMAAALRGAAAIAVPPPPATTTRATTPPQVPGAPAKSKVPLIAGLCLVGGLGLGGAALYVSRRGDAPPAKPPADAATAVGTPGADAAPASASDPWAGSGSSTWKIDPKAFPAGAETPPKLASSVGATKFVMLADDTTSRWRPGDGDVAKINFKMWRISDRTLVDSNIGGAPVSFEVAGNGLGRSEVLQLMTKGDVARIWTEVTLVDGSGDSKMTPVLFDLELVSFTSTHCKGTYALFSDLAITLTGDQRGPCGNYVFIDSSTPERPTCAGALSCDGARSKFACDYKGVKIRLAGDMTWTCNDGVLTANVTIGGSTTPWELPWVSD